MARPLVIDVSKSLPSRPRHLSPAALPNIFGGCLAQGQACASTADCCQVPVQPGDYVLCYFYRGHGGFVSGYCTKSSSAYG
jgi:hypothetical protein